MIAFSLLMVFGTLLWCAVRAYPRGALRLPGLGLRPGRAPQKKGRGRASGTAGHLLGVGGVFFYLERVRERQLRPVRPSGGTSTSTTYYA